MTQFLVENDDAPDTYVSTSGIEGAGLFAARRFDEGELVLDYTLFKEDWYEMKYEDLSEEQIRKNWYVMVDEHRCITSDKYSKFSYINHSRTPNCFWDVANQKISAAKPIEQGEEIFIDYRLEPRPNRTTYPDWI